MNKGRLILAGAPLGNPEDASPRLKKALSEADVIFAEDTRRFRHLAQDLELDISAAVHSFFAGNERERINELRDLLASGRTLVLITDGGMPGVSDPGYLAIHSALELGAQLEVVPGPSAVTTALEIGRAHV